MPPIGLLLGRVDFSNLYLTLKTGAPAGPYASLSDAQAAGAVTMNFGLFVNTLIEFLIVALAIFLLIRFVNRLQKPAPATPAPATKDCPFCLSAVPLKATRCPHCTSTLEK